MTKEAVLIPVFNEERYIRAVLYELRAYHRGLIVFIDDGSFDGSQAILKDLEGAETVVLRNDRNDGYGASLIRGFRFAVERGIETVVTMDCDWQHEPHMVPEFFRALGDYDVVSGSRYLTPQTGAAPADRRAINEEITRVINDITGLSLTDAFCGFKTYRVAALKKLDLNETGYAFPIQFWIQAAAAKLKIAEKSVPLIYLEAARSFGGSLDEPVIRLQYYRKVIEEERKRWRM